MENLTTGRDPADFANDDLDDTLCTICSLVCRNPRRPKSCDHSFCHSCIGRYIVRGGVACPLCRAEIGTHADLRESPVCDGLQHNCCGFVGDEHKCSAKEFPCKYCKLPVSAEALGTTHFCDEMIKLTIRQNDFSVRFGAQEIDFCAICATNLTDPCITCDAFGQKESFDGSQECGLKRGTKCSHLYHAHCIERWYRRHPYCPLDDVQQKFEDVEY